MDDIAHSLKAHCHVSPELLKDDPWGSISKVEEMARKRVLLEAKALNATVVTIDIHWECWVEAMAVEK